MSTTKHLQLQKSIPIQAPRLPLWAILVVPFIIIIVVVVSSINYLSYRNSRAVVDDIAGQLMSEINARIEAHIEPFFKIPQIINRTNANLIQHQMLDITNVDEIGHYFGEEIRFYDSVSSMYLGNPDGGLVSGGREGTDGSLYVITSDNFQSGAISKYATDESGNLTDLLVQIPNFDARVRPWYIGAMDRGGVYWTEPYVLATQQDLAIASSLPIYDDSGDLLGVVSVDLFISQINDFLQGIEIGKSGQTYIIEHSGLLIATSSDTPTVYKQDDETWHRISVLNSKNATIARSAQYILDEFGGFVEFDDSVQRSIWIEGKEHYLWVSSFHKIDGLDWTIVTIIPEEDFLAAISAHNQIALLLIILALVVAVAVGIVTALYVSRPITRLSAAATKLADVDWSQKVPIEGVEEVRRLGRAFNTMSSQLQELFNELEDRVQERTAELALSEARYRGMLEDQTELICRFTPDYTLTFVNGAYARYFDKSSQEFIGKSFMPHLPEEDQIYLEQQLALISPTNRTVKVEHRVITVPKQVQWMQWVNRAFYDDSGQLTEIQAVGRDITERKQYEDTLQKALARETELNELKSHFITTVSHEFRTPMTIILNSSEIMQRYGDRLDTEQKTKHFKRIHEQIHHMTRLLEDVLTIQQAEVGSLEFNPTELDLVALCHEVLGDFQTTTQDVSIDFSHPKGCHSVWLDARLLRTIIINLISNAAKYSPEGGKVDIRLDCNPELFLLSVKDEGIGIPETVQSQIFDPFFRANNVGTIAGTGLGLAIVKQCVESHNGNISVESKLGEGTTFTIQLPNVNFKENENENDSRD